nr:uncharacterized protein LOC128697766 isoform X5 [Cherax quadricarinatus]
MKDKEKGRKEDWYLPWVIRPELLRTHQHWQRGGTPTPGSSPSTGSHCSSSSSNAWAGSCQEGSPVLCQPPGSPRKRPVGPSISLHEGLLRCGSGVGPPGDCHHHSYHSYHHYHHHNNAPHGSPTTRRPIRQLHLRARSYDGSSSRQDSKSDRSTNDKGSPGPPTSRRNSNTLRQCDSLENVCDTNYGDQLENGLGVATQPVVSNAFSLPHINQLSDYEDDHVLHHDPPAENGHSHNDNTTTTSKPANKRSDKTKKTKLKRRRAYYRTPKDGRSKSLTHIDTLEDSNMLLSGEEMESREGATDKLGVPDPHSLRRRKLSLATKVSSCEYMVLLLECFVDPVEEFVQASRGTTLRDVLERRGVETTGIQVFPDGSRTPLPLNTDTYVLGGKTLRVRGRYQ